MKVDPTNFEHQEVPLWAVLDGARIECVMVNCRSGGPAVWGYSVWRRSPGFRTLGISLASYMARAREVEFYAEQQHALDAVKEATAPSKKLVKDMLDKKQLDIRYREAWAQHGV